jgi:hypothetical protein
MDYFIHDSQKIVLVDLPWVWFRAVVYLCFEAPFSILAIFVHSSTAHPHVFWHGYCGCSAVDDNVPGLALFLVPARIGVPFVQILT